MRISDELIQAELDVMRRVSGLSIDPVALAVASNIWRASQLFRQQMEQEILRQYELTWSSFSTLFIIWIWGPVEMSAIAASQHVTRPTVTSSIDTLERRGYCVREPMRGQSDRRFVEVALTDAGRALIEEVFPRFNQGERSFTACLTHEEAVTLARLLRKVIRNNDKAQENS